MSGRPNSFPRPKVTIRQWMIFLAVLAAFNYLAVLAVQQIPQDRLSAEQVRLRTAVAFLVMNGFVIGYGVFFLVLGWWSRVYHHTWGLPDPPRRMVFWRNVYALCFALFITLTNIAIQSYLDGSAGPGVIACLAAAACLFLGLLVSAVRKIVQTARKQTDLNKPGASRAPTPDALLELPDR